jgi:hypothetical protein
MKYRGRSSGASHRRFGRIKKQVAAEMPKKSVDLLEISYLFILSGVEISTFGSKAHPTSPTYNSSPGRKG